MSYEKLFSVEEANALIPTLEALLSQIQLKYVQVQRILEPLGEPTVAVRRLPLSDEVERRLREHPELRTLLNDIERLIKAVYETGAEFKGIELGLVDFPFLGPDGEIAYLCWQYGEKQVRWWHGLSDGFVGRKPLPGATVPSQLN